MTSVSATDNSTIPLRLEQMTVRLGGHAIVDGAELTIAAGEMVLLTGANGAGKSTLLRAVVGLLPYGGDVEVLGRYPTSAEAREQVVFVPDEPALYEDMTLAEHVRFTAILYGRPDAEPIMTGMLEGFGLGARLDEFPATHSRGMRQKLSLSLALGLGMPLTLLDEPFNGLDLASQERLADTLNGLCAGGGAVLLTGHQGDLQDRLTARVAMLEAGRLVA